MFKISHDKRMTIVQGDTAIFTVNVDNYVFNKHDVAYFTIKKSIKDNEVVIQKRITEFKDNSFKVFLDSKDTNVPVDVYLYDIQLSLSDGRVDTIILPTKFTVIGGITHD